MLKRKFKIGDILRTDTYQRKETDEDVFYYILQGRRHLRNREKEFIVFRINKRKIPGTYIVKEKNAIKVLDCKIAERFSSDKELLIYLKIYDE